MSAGETGDVSGSVNALRRGQL